MNGNTEYELLTRSIYESLLREEGLTVNVQHNLNLQGYAASHQIDVYWEYEIASVLFRVAIECKNYKSKFAIGTVRSFHAVLNDIGNINGIIISRNGFQKGAIEYAKHYGIQLHEVRKPVVKDWDGKIKRIEFHPTMIMIQNAKLNFLFDEEWIKDNYEIDEKGKVAFYINDRNDRILIVDSDGKKICSIHDMESKLPRTETLNMQGLTYTYTFEEAYLVDSNHNKFKINGVVYTYDILKVDLNPIVIDGEAIVSAIKKNVLSGDIKFIHKK